MPHPMHHHHHHVVVRLVLTLTVWIALAIWPLLRATEQEITIIVIKPDAMERGLQSTLLELIVAEYRVLCRREFTWTEDLVNEFYFEHRLKSFFPELKVSLLGGTSMVILVSGPAVIAKWRVQMRELRERYALDMTRNALHGSDSTASAKFEQHLLFMDMPDCQFG